MRIERLTFERYGRFADRTLLFRSDAPLHVVMGPNESGKTTALSAIADLLFGFGQRTPYDFLHDGKALRLGAELRLANGRTLSFRRRKGNKNTLIDDREQPLPDDFLLPITGSVTRDTFIREFGLTAEALREGGQELLKAGGRLADTLAASSAGLVALSQLREKLAAGAEQVFTPRKSAGKDFYMALERYEQADRKLRDAIVTADALLAADAAVEAAEVQLNDLTDQHGKAGRELKKFERCLRTRTTLARLDSLNSRLQELSGLPQVSGQMLVDWRTAMTEDLQAAEKLRELAESDARDNAEIDDLAIDEGLLSCGTEIDTLCQQLGAVRKAIEDLPRRVEAQRSAIADLDELARRLGLPGHESLLERRPADPALDHARQLVELRIRADARLQDAEDRLSAAIRNRDDLVDEAQHPAHCVDPAPLRQKLDALANVVGDANRLRTDSAACSAEELRIAEAARTLNPPLSDPEMLAALPLPDEAEIADYAATMDELAKAQQLASSDRDEVERMIAEASAEIARLAQGGISATRADLHAARIEREQGFESLHAALDGDTETRTLQFTALRSLTRAVDAVTDKLLSDTDRAARRQSAEDRLSEATARQRTQTNLLNGIVARKAEIEAAWHGLWAPSGLAPRAPAAMTRWRQSVTALADRRYAMLQWRAATAALASGIEDSRAAILKLMADHGRTPDAAQPADLLYREASTWLAELQTAWTEARKFEAKRAAAERNIQIAEAEVNLAREQSGRQGIEWPGAVAAIGLAASASPVEAQAALKVWQEVGEPKLKLVTSSRQVDTIEADIANFNKDVAALSSRASPGFAAGDAQSILQKLAEQLLMSRGEEVRRSTLQKAVLGRRAKRAGLLTRRSDLLKVLTEACCRIGLTEVSQFEASLEKLEDREKAETERSATARDLIEISDGLDEAVLRDEQGGLDADALPGEIERLALHQKVLLQGIQESSAELSRTRRLRDDLAKGRDAPGAARERAEAAAELLGISRRWIVTTAAARLATRAIERHRAAVQDPLLSRAGELFAVATAEGFTGLAADYDDADQVALVAMRGNGERVPLKGLSEGTRDQLFLALRLALLERRGVETLPFIADDLLSGFDEERTLRMLELLGQFGQATQVIVFTHHAHVCELARRAVPGVDLIAL